MSQVVSYDLLGTFLFAVSIRLVVHDASHHTFKLGGSAGSNALHKITVRAHDRQSQDRLNSDQNGTHP